MIFLQTVAEDNAVNMIEFEAQQRKAKNMAEFGSDEASDADKLIVAAKSHASSVEY